MRRAIEARLQVGDPGLLRRDAAGAIAGDETDGARERSETPIGVVGAQNEATLDAQVEQIAFEE